MKNIAQKRTLERAQVDLGQLQVIEADLQQHVNENPEDKKAVKALKRIKKVIQFILNLIDFLQGKLTKSQE